MFWRIKSFFSSLRCWFSHNTNRNKWRTIKSTIKMYPFDASFMYEPMRSYLVELKEYFKTATIIDKSYYNEYIKQIDLAIALADIAFERTKVATYQFDTLDINGKIDYSNPKKDMLVYCNIKNHYRFGMPQNVAERFPDALYIEKARRLFWRVLEQYSPYWCD